MDTRKGISDTDLQAIVKAEIQNADGMSGSQLAAERAQNMDYYQGRKFGNEIEGRSSVVSSDVSDTIEWMLPTLIRIFCSGEDAVCFEPETENDVETAKQSTDYVNYIWNRDNSGFLNTYSWFKDALLQKNGTIKIWWDDKPQEKRERYTGLDETSFAYLVADEDVEVAEHTEYQESQVVQRPDKTGALLPETIELTLHDVVITRSIPRGRVCVVPVPPEEFLISKDARNIADARLVGHRKQVTLSDLRQDGVKPDVLERLSGDNAEADSNMEAVARNTVEDNTPGGNNATVNEAMRTVWRIETWIKADVDGDGIAEMRKVVVAGPGYEMLSNEPWDTPRPFADITPIIMPHRYHGLAVADGIKDLQLIKSTILRQYLDNLYLANNAREQVIESAIVDPQELLSSAPGRKIRLKNVTGPAIFPIVVQDIGPAALAGLEYIDQLRENRTGVSPRTQGLGANQLHETAAGERMLMTAAMGKIELIARIFAETGVKDAFRIILKLVCAYQDKARTIRLRDKWVAMDPSQWNADMDMTVQVGMGMGDRDRQLMYAQMLGQLQEKALALGFVTPENFKNTAEIVTNAMGFKGVDRFFTFPKEGQQMPPQPPNPEMVKVQGQMQLEQAKMQSSLQIEQMKEQNAAAMQQREIEAEMQKEAANAQAQAAVQQHLNELENARKLNEISAEKELATYKANLEWQAEQAKLAQAAQLSEIENQTELSKARIQQETAITVAQINATKAAEGTDQRGTEDKKADAMPDKELHSKIDNLSRSLGQFVETHTLSTQMAREDTDKLHKALTAEKEIVRDSKTGKPMGVRIKGEAASASILG